MAASENKKVMKKNAKQIQKDAKHLRWLIKTKGAPLLEVIECARVIGDKAIAVGAAATAEIDAQI